MQKGFTQVTLGLLGAALLSSSAFAVGPTISGLPNVFITDNTKLVPGPAVPDPGDGATPATNIYRFTAAITLADYVTNDTNSDLTTDAGELAAAKWLFTESDAGGTLRTAGTRRLTIGGNLGENVVPDYATITTTNRDVAGPALDFVNVALTPDLATDGTAPAGGVEEALVAIYVSAIGDTGATVAVDSFSVFTTNDDLVAEGDIATEPSTIYSPGYCSEDMAPWFTNNAQQFAAGVMLPATTGTSVPEYAGFPNVPVTQSVAPDLSLETDGSPTGWVSGPNAFQFVSWKSFSRELVGTPRVAVATDDTLVKIRWTLSADAATQAAAATDRRGTAAQAPLIRLRSGENSPFGNGQAVDQYAQNSSNAITEAGRTVSTYFYAKRGGNYVAASGIGAPIVDNAPVEVGFYYDILDLYSTAATFPIYGTGTQNRDYGLTLSKIEAFTAPVSSLSNETVVFNQGASVVLPASGETAPPAASLAQFNLEWWDSRVEAGPATGNRLTLTPVEENVIGVSNFLRFSIVSGTTAFGGQWDASDFANIFGTDTVAVLGQDDLITVGNDKLVRVSAWLSTNVAPGAKLPGTNDFSTGGGSFARLGYSAEFNGETGDADFSGDQAAQGRVGYTEFSMTNDILDHIDTFEVLEPVYGLENGPSTRVDFFFEPGVIGSTLSFRPRLSVWGFPVGADTVSTIAANVDINRVVVYTYDLPGEPAGCDNVNN